MEYYASTSTSSMHYSAQASQQDQQSHENQQFWEPHPAAGFCSSNSDTPVFTNPFDIKHSLDVHVAQSGQVYDDSMFAQNIDFSFAQSPVYEHHHHQHHHHQQQFFQHQHQQPTYPYVEALHQQHMAHGQHGYYAPSPTLSDLSSLSSGGMTNSPLSPPHLLTPASPSHHAHFTPLSPVMAAHPMMLPPMPLDASSIAAASTSTLLPPSSPSPSASSSYSDSNTPPAMTTIAPSTTSTGPADGQYAVLTLTGHTIAASGSYKDVLSAARSVRKANESGLVDDSRTCPFCGKVCDRPSTLKTHLNSHTGARPHTCTVPGCGRQFTVLSNMYRHAKVCAAQRARDVRRAAAAAAALRR